MAGVAEVVALARAVMVVVVALANQRLPSLLVKHSLSTSERLARQPVMVVVVVVVAFRHSYAARHIYCKQVVGVAAVAPLAQQRVVMVVQVVARRRQPATERPVVALAVVASVVVASPLAVPAEQQVQQVQLVIQVRQILVAMRAAQRQPVQLPLLLVAATAALARVVVEVAR